MFKYWVHFLTADGWRHHDACYGGIYKSLYLAEVQAGCLRAYPEVQTVLISRIWIPHTERA